MGLISRVSSRTYRSRNPATKTMLKLLPRRPKLAKLSIHLPKRPTSSLNQNEVNNFNNQAQNFWHPTGESKILHQMNSVRVPFIRQALEKDNLSNPDSEADFCYPLSGLNILDVGCGTGILSEPLAKLGANLVSIDASEEMIKFAKCRQENALEDSNFEDVQSIEYLNTTIEDLKISLPNLKNSFDLVVSSEVIEHIDGPKINFLENLSHFVDKK